MTPTARQALVERLEALHSFLIHEGEETGSGWVVQPGDHQQTVRDVLALLRADEAEPKGGDAHAERSTRPEPDMTPAPSRPAGGAAIERVRELCRDRQLVLHSSALELADMVLEELWCAGRGAHEGKD